MPSALTYPGVYIEEIPSGVRTITGVATSITAFVGRALRGPVDTPVTIGSYGEFERIFGGRWKPSYLGYAVRDFFQNGGAQAVIVRLFASGLKGDAEQETAEIEAKTAAAKAGADAQTAAGITGAKPSDVVKAAEDAKTGFSKAHQKAAIDFVVARAQAKLDAGGSVAQVGQEAADAADAAAAAAVPELTARIKLALEDGSEWWLKAAYPGSWGNALRARVDLEVQKGADGKADPNLFNLTIRDGGTGAIEQFRNLSFDENHARRADRVLNAQSALVTAKDPPTARPKAHDTNPKVDVWSDDPPPPPPPPSGPPPPGPPLPPPPPVWSSKVGDPTGDGAALADTDYTGDGLEGAKRGLYALDKLDLFNLLVLPPAKPDGSISKELVSAAAKYCEKRRAMLLVDPLPGWDEASDQVSAVETGVDTGEAGSVSNNAAIFFPRLTQADPENDGREARFPPSGAVAGVFARTDANRGVWKAPAGLEAVLSGVAKLSVPLTDFENGRLNMRGVNCLRFMAGVGPVVWGSRTRMGDDRNPNDWKYIPVRRTALFIEESLYRGTHWVVFEPNDERLWASIRLNVGAFMQQQFRKGAFQGQAARDAYFVKCDGETTTQPDINLGIVNILVGFAPLKPAEFVVIRIQQIAGNIPT
jgi:uncharacterized protein